VGPSCAFLGSPVSDSGCHLTMLPDALRAASARARQRQHEVLQAIAQVVVVVLVYGRIRDPRLNNLRLLVRGWRQQAAEAEVHGGGAVMVGPVVGEGDQCESPWCFAAAPELNRIAQLGVRYFRHRRVAEVE
jgi:hypothetical protein